MVAVGMTALHIVAAGKACGDMVAGMADDVHQIGVVAGTAVVVAAASGGPVAVGGTTTAAMPQQWPAVEIVVVRKPLRLWRPSFPNVVQRTVSLYLSVSLNCDNTPKARLSKMCRLARLHKK
jgi:hypothetical protein